MIKYFLHTLRVDFKSNPKLIIGLLCVMGVGLVIAGVVMATSFIVPEPPDAATASLEEIAEYLKSDYYLELSFAQRKAYIKTFSARIEKMPFKEQKRAEKMFNEIRKANPEVAKAMHVGYASEKLKMLDAKTPEQQIMKIRATMAVMEMAKGRKGMQEEYDKMMGRTSEERVVKMREALQAAPEVYQNTSIEERRRMRRTMMNVKREVDRRYGR